MKPFYFLFLSVVVAMGQTGTIVDPKNPFDQESPSKQSVLELRKTTRIRGDGFCSDIISDERGVFVVPCDDDTVPSCDEKTFKPGNSSCDTQLTFRGHSKTIKELFPEECGGFRPSYRACRANEASTLPDHICFDMVPVPQTDKAAPKPESAEPLSLAHAFDWQAIADHCHIEATTPVGFMLTKPPDGWYAVTGMRIVCK
jgi:hypothetical protein